MKKYIILSFLMLVFVFSHAQNKTGFYYKKKGRNTFASYTPDGKYLAVSKKKRLSFYRCNTLYIDRSLKSKGRIKQFAVTSENTLTATYSRVFFRNYLSVWNYESLIVIKRIKLKKGKLIDFSFINDSSIAYIDNKSNLRILNLSTGQYSYDTLLSDRPLRTLSVVGDEGILAAGGADRKLYVMNIYNKSIQTFAGPENWIRTIDIFSDGTKIVCGSDDKRFYYYDLTDRSKNFNFMAHKDWLRDVKFTQDGNYIASVSDDKSCAFYDLKNHQINFKIKQIPLNSNIYIHPFGKDFILNSPDNKEVYVRDISALNIIPFKKLKDKSDKLPPQIYISQPARIEEGKVIVFNHLYPVTGTAIDESGLRDIKVNGRAIKVKENGSFLIYVPLAIGDNPISIEAIDINDNVSIKKFILIRKSELGEDIDTTQARNHLVVIGINEYTSWPTLGNAVRDAKSIYSVLKEKYGFDSLHATILLDSAATKENIDKTLRGLISKVASSDNLIIYYAGHGYFDPILNEGYWIPVNAQNQSDYLSNTILLKYLANINSKHTFLVVDACFSGSLFATRNRGYVENVEKYRSRWCLTSGRLETVADGAYGENSPFASSFIDFLNNNSKGEFPVSEIVQYVKLQVANSSNQTPIGSPLRDVGDEGGEFVFKKKK